jgi:hypothetical protein
MDRIAKSMDPKNKFKKKPSINRGSTTSVAPAPAVVLKKEDTVK